MSGYNVGRILMYPSPSLEDLLRSAEEEAGVCPHGGRLQEC